MALGLRRWDDALAALGAAALAVVLFPGALLRGESFYERDLHLDWYPRLEAIARALHEGAWPVWDPSIGFGQPLLADPGAQVAYPGTFLALLAPRPLAYTVFVLAHLVLTAVGTRRLGRVAGAGRAGSLTASALWLLGGPLQSSVNLWHHFAGACWAPWVLLGVGRVVRRPGARPVLALAAAGALQALAGSAEACAMTWAFAAGWAALRWPRRGRRRAAIALALALMLLVGLSAVVWRPAVDVLSRAPRRDLPEDVRTAWSVPLPGLLRLVAPLDPARVPFSAPAWQALYDRPTHPFLLSLYLGLPALALGAAALAEPSSRRRALFLLAVAFAAGAYALGPHGPVYPVMTALVPPLRILRYPSKAMLLFGLAAALLAGLGGRAIARGALRGRRGLGAGLALVGVTAWVAISAARYRDVAGLAALLAFSGGAVLLLHAAARLQARVAAAALALLAGADLLAAHADLNPTAPATLVFDPPPVVGRVDRTAGRRLYVYDYHSIPGTSERLLGRPDPYRHPAPPAGVDPRRLEVLAQRLYLPPPSAGLFGLEGSYDMDLRGLYPRDLNDLTFFLRSLEGTKSHARLLGMGAVGTVLSLHTAGLLDLQPLGSLPSLFPEPIRAWRVPGEPTRSWVVGCARVADGGEALRALADPAFDASREVLLPVAAADASACGPAGTSRVFSFRSDRVGLEVDARAPGFAVLADAWDPGWRVTLDGRAVPLLRANVAFRAVAVPAGRLRIEMVYRPRAVIEGLGLSGTSLVLAIGVAWRARRRGRSVTRQ